MMDYLYQTSDPILFLIVSGFLLLFSLMSLYLIKWYFPLHLRYQDNTVIGCAVALIGLIYGVLAGFATAHLINNNTLAIDALQHESNSIANLYRDSGWLKEPVQGRIRSEIRQYLSDVLNIEWPLMSIGKTVTNEGGLVIDRISDELKQYKMTSNTDQIIVTEMLDIIKNLYDGRQQRIQLSYASLDVEIWIVILLGTILTLCISYIYGMFFYLHVFTVLTSALMMSSIIFLLISLDKPFQGEFVVGPSVYQDLVVQMAKS